MLEQIGEKLSDSCLLNKGAAFSSKPFFAYVTKIIEEGSETKLEIIDGFHSVTAILNENA